jgi:signal transduction histidine kinase
LLFRLGLAFDSRYAWQAVTTHVLTCGIAAALSIVLGIIFQSVARAPGWRHYRRHALAALVVAVFALASIGYSLLGGLNDLVVVLLTSGLFLSALDLSRRVTANARSLGGLNDQLEERIAARTREIMIGRDALLSSEKFSAMGQLAAGVSHEVNNPLSYVRGNLDYIHEVLTEDHDREDPRTIAALAAVDEALDGAERIRKIVVGLAAYARSAPVSGAASVADALDVAMRVVRPQTRLSMSLHLELDDTTSVALDESKLVQALVSILLNAADSCRGIEPMPQTEIQVSKDADVVVIEIRDQGRGMTPTALQSAFEPLARGGSSGLGLYLSRSLIEAAGGRIDIESEPDQGTTVRLRLPTSAKRSLSFSASLTAIPVVPEAE